MGLFGIAHNSFMSCLWVFFLRTLISKYPLTETWVGMKLKIVAYLSSLSWAAGEAILPNTFFLKQVSFTKKSYLQSCFSKKKVALLMKLRCAKCALCISYFLKFKNIEEKLMVVVLLSDGCGLWIAEWNKENGTEHWQLSRATYLRTYITLALAHIYTRKKSTSP
jgi:hypothetical protein